MPRWQEAEHQNAEAAKSLHLTPADPNQYHSHPVQALLLWFALFNPWEHSFLKPQKGYFLIYSANVSNKSSSSGDNQKKCWIPNEEEMEKEPI